MLTIIDSDLLRACLAIIGSMCISLLAFKAKALSISGALSAFVMGASFVFFGEPIWFVLLLTFFISSTFWSIFKKHTKNKRTAEHKYEKSGRRDGWQVFANGGIGMLLCAIHYFLEIDSLIPLYIMIMASVTADTWATEIGGLSQTKPRHIINRTIVEPGTSGGITYLGTGAALAGSASIGIVAVMMSGVWTYLLLAVAAGFISCMLDSLLGATVQRMYLCQICGSIIEKPNHCEQPSLKIRGLMWVNNDVVNGVSSILGTAVVWILYVIVR